jgi:hypothetical protein
MIWFSTCTFSNKKKTKEIFFPFTVEAVLTIARAGSKWLHPGLYFITIGQQRMFSIELDGQSIR